MKQKILSENQTTGNSDCRSSGRNGSFGPCHPPKNSSVAMQPTVIMFTYSAIKNATICGKINQCGRKVLCPQIVHVSFWLLTISRRLKVPDNSNTPTSDSP